MTTFPAGLGGFLRRDSVRLAGVLAVAAVIALLYRDAGAEAVTHQDPAARREMPEISAPDLQGNRWSLAGQRGNIVLVNFWASWCPPCRAETPALVRLSNAYAAKGVKVVGISMDDNADDVRRFVTRYQVPYPIVRPDLSTGPASTVEGLPTSFLLDRNGRIAKSYLGAVQERDLVRDVEWLLAE